MALTLYTRFYINLTGNPVWVDFSGGSIPSGATEYKYILQVESTDNKLLFAPYSIAIAPDASMEAKFNIQGYIDQAVSKVFQWPVSGGAVLRTDPTFEIELRAGERYIDVIGQLVETMQVTTTPIIGFKGGVSQRQLDIWGDALSFESEYLQNSLFLTQRPQGDIVHQHQPVKLWSFEAVATSANNLKLTCTYSDGSITVKDVTISFASTGLYELNVNPYHHAVPLTSNGANLVSWSAALYLDDILASDIRYFVYDLRTIERPFWLLFSNSLGGIDDVYLSGYASEDFKAAGNEVYIPAQRTNTVFDRTLIVPNKKGRNVWQINTGPKSVTQMLHLRDLLLSREAWLLYPNNGITNYYVIPVNITNSTAQLVDRMKDLWDIGLEMEEAHSSEFNFDNRRY